MASSIVIRILHVIEILTKNTLGVKKVAAKNLKKAWMKKK